MDKLVSVIIPNYNCAEFLDKCLESVVNQTYKNIEIVICDNASTDNSVEIFQRWAEKDERIRLLTTEVNQGGMKCYNRLFKEAKGDYIMIQDSDDWCDLERVAKQAAVLDNYDVGCCMTNSIYYYQHSEPEYPARPGSSIVTIDTYEDWAPATIMFRREILDTIPGYHLFWDRVTSYDNYFIMDIMEKFGAYYIDEYLYFVWARSNSDHRSIDLKDPNGLRKLISFDIYQFLKKQRKETGTDYLNDNKLEELKAYEKSLLDNKKLISDKIRMFASIQIDYGKHKNAWELMRKAIQVAPFFTKNYRTLMYLVRSQLKLTGLLLPLTYFEASDIFLNPDTLCI